MGMGDRRGSGVAVNHVFFRVYCTDMYKGNK